MLIATIDGQGFINSIGIQPVLPVYQEPWVAMDITDIEPMPKEGDYHDGLSFIDVDTLGDYLTWDKLEILPDNVDAATLTLNMEIYEITVTTPLGDVLSDTVDDGTYVLSVDEPGVYFVDVSIFPYNTVRYEIIAAVEVVE